MKFRSTVLISSLALAALAISAQASADCKYPPAPQKVPDGSKATKQEMLDGKKDVVAYDALIVNYTDCLKSEHDAAVAKIDPSLDEAKKTKAKNDLDAVWQKKNDAAVADDQALAARFNEQIKAYNAAHKG